ncbi:MAG: IPT/TIG domain-containing protein [Pseudonocardiaceae bacterium]
MVFRVYPDPQTDPLTVAAGATSAPVPIAELIGVSIAGPTIFIRFVLVGTECTPPAAPAPTVVLVAQGTEDEIISVGGQNPTPVASGNALATVYREGRRVFRVEIYKSAAAPIDWEIKFRNNDPAAAHKLTWVVADVEAETRQPWIEAPHEAVWPTMPSGIQPGQAVPLTVQVANKGTGNLVISDVPGRLEASDFTLLTVPEPIAPNACGNLEFEFTPPTTSGRSTVSYTAKSNDSTASESPEVSHNKRLDLVAEVGIPRPAFNSSPPQLSPDKGAPGTRVTLNGRNFDVGTPEVQFGAATAALVGAPTPTGVTAVVPGGLSPGGVQITVTTDGGTAVSDDVFTVLGLPPQVGGFTPPRGRSEDPETSTPGTIVTITGNHFDSGTTVTFGDEPAVIDNITNTRILTKAPTLRSGNYLITVGTQWGQTRSTAPFVVVPKPAFNPSPRQFSPGEGAPGVTVTLNGRNFSVGTPGVRFGTVAAASVGVPTPTGVTAVVPARLPLGGVQITVTTDGGTAVSDDFFDVQDPPPQLGGFTPLKGRSEDPETSTPGTIVTITGNHFDENVGAETTVKFGDEPAVVDDITNTRILTKVPIIPSGNHLITVATRWGQVRSTAPFVVVPKPAFNASPRQFSPGEGAPGMTVTLNGRNFGVGTPEVRFGTVAAASVGVPTPAGVTAVVPAGLPPGAVQITVTTDGGTAVSDDFFTVRGLPPRLDGITPLKGRAEDPATSTPGTIVTITGDHFDAGTTVTYGDKPAVVDEITKTRILTKVPAIPIGDYPVTVATQWGQARSTVPFVVQDISASGELARRTRIRAFRREPSNVLIVARGENPTSGYRVDIEQSPEDVSPPKFNLLRFPPGDIKPSPVEPYRYEEVVPFPPDKPRITINHAGGSDVVNIGRTYVVRRNDTMGEIAADFRISLAALTAANPQIPNINRITPGQLINIPLTYVVQRGDTMSEIAVKFGVSLDALKAENPQIRNPNLIRPGQVLVIP